MSGPPERPESLQLPRLSRTSVFMPTIVSASDNPGTRKNSDGLNISPFTSQERLSDHKYSTATEEEDDEYDEDGDVTPVRLDAEDQDGPQTLEQLVKSKQDSRNDSTSTSATGPAGSGMPPAEAAFICEKEVVEEEEERDDDVLEMSPPQPRIKSTLLGVPIVESPHLVQSPRPMSSVSRIGSLDATNMVVNDADSNASQLARLGSRFTSQSSLSTHGSRRSITEDATGIMFHTAQTARLKRPSIVNYIGNADSARRLSGMRMPALDHDDPISMNNLVSRSKTVAVPSLRERERWSRGLGLLSMSSEYDAIEVSPGLSVDRLGNALNPPNTVANVSEEDLQRQTDSLTLRDALRINPVNMDGTPKRSATVPSSIGTRRKARFSPLPLGSNPTHTFRRDSVITTPYPKPREEEEQENYSTEEKAGKKITQSYERDLEDGSGSFDLIILARNRTRVVSISEFEKHRSSTKFWWKGKRNDDEHIVRLARREYTRLIGKPRSVLGARTAKAVRLRFVHSNKGLHAREPDTPLIDSHFGSFADDDFWRVWNNPAAGRKSRHWLDILLHKYKIYGISRSIVLDIEEGYNATRVIIAASVVTAVSLIAMFLWLFLGAGGEGNTTTVIDGTVIKPNSNLIDSSGRAGDAFMFGIWVLFMGWTGVAGWLVAS